MFSRIVDAIAPSTPFVGPEELERQQRRSFLVRVGANESAFGISAAARDAMSEVLSRVSRYGDPENFDLRSELARQNGVAVDNVLIGSGIDDLFALLVHALIDPGAAVVTSLGSYPTFNYFVVGYGGSLHRVPYQGDSVDLKRLAHEAKSVDARLVYLANPDNPTGTFHGRDDVLQFVKLIPKGCVLVLDEAYLDFVPRDDLIPIDCENSTVIRLRTFSKAHGMAGMRIGYALTSHDLIAGFNKVRIQFGVNRLAQIGALASLRDPAFLAQVVDEVSRGRADYERMGRELGVRTLESHTNFVSFDFESSERAETVLTELLRRGVFVRSGVPPFDRLVRVTIGTKAERATFEPIFRSVVSGF